MVQTIGQLLLVSELLLCSKCLCINVKFHKQLIGPQNAKYGPTFISQTILNKQEEMSIQAFLSQIVEV